MTVLGASLSPFRPGAEQALIAEQARGGREQGFCRGNCVRERKRRCSDGRGSSRRALPRLPAAGVESHRRLVVPPQALASQHRHRLRWHLRRLHPDRHEVGSVGATAFDAGQACAIANVVQKLRGP